MEYEISAVLAPTDFSEQSARALAVARSFARQWNASLHLIHVIEPASLPAEGGSAALGVTDLDSDRAEEAGARLREQADELTREGFAVKTDLLRGRASSMIIDYASNNAIDLIVIATHGRTGLGHLLFGSTAERVVREAPCPVLTIRPRTEETAS